MSIFDDAQVAGNELIAKVAEQTETIEVQQATINSIQGALDWMSDYAHRLEDDLEACRAALPPAAKGVLGWNKEGLPARRLYATWSTRSSKATEATAVRAAGHPVLISIKPPAVSTTGLTAVANGQYDSQYQAWFQSLPEDANVAFFHEPENDGVTAASFRAHFDRLAPLLGPKQVPVVCLMGWTFEDASGRDWQSWLPAKAAKIALDVYSWAFTPDRGGEPWRSPQQLLAPATAKLFSDPRPLSVWETNAAEDPSNPDRKADWIRAWGPAAEERKLAEVAFFDSTSTQPGQFKLVSSAAANVAVGDLSRYPYFA